MRRLPLNIDEQVHDLAELAGQARILNAYRQERSSGLRACRRANFQSGDLNGRSAQQAKLILTGQAGGCYLAPHSPIQRSCENDFAWLRVLLRRGAFRDGRTAEVVSSAPAIIAAQDAPINRSRGSADLCRKCVFTVYGTLPAIGSHVLLCFVSRRQRPDRSRIAIRDLWKQRGERVAGEIGNKASAFMDALHNRLEDAAHYLRQYLCAVLAVGHQVVGNWCEAGDIHEKCCAIERATQPAGRKLFDDEGGNQGTTHARIIAWAS